MQQRHASRDDTSAVPSGPSVSGAPLLLSSLPNTYERLAICEAPREAVNEGTLLPMKVVCITQGCYLSRHRQLLRKLPSQKPDSILHVTLCTCKDNNNFAQLSYSEFNVLLPTECSCQSIARQYCVQAILPQSDACLKRCKKTHP